MSNTKRLVGDPVPVPVDPAGAQVSGINALLRREAKAACADPCLSHLQAGGIADAEMFRTFNMGVGMIIVVDQADVEAVLHAGLGAFRIGDITQGEGVTFV